MWAWYDLLTKGRARMTQGAADLLLAATSENLENLRAALVLHHEQVELALLDVKRLGEQIQRTRNVLAPGRATEAPEPIQLSAERRQR